MRDSFVSGLLEVVEDNPAIMVLTGDLGFGVLTDFAKLYPHRYINVGVAEQNMTGLAAGLAQEGKTVFTYSIGNFPILRCLEQLRNDVCYHSLNVKVVSVGAGFSYGPLGASHHATEDLSVALSMPNLEVFSPCTKEESLAITKELVSRPGPGYLRLDKSAATEPTEVFSKFSFGRTRTFLQGHDITLVCLGAMVECGIAAAEMLKKLGISVRVLGVHSVQPLDFAPINLAAKETGGIVTLEEHSLPGGLGSLIAASLLENGVAPAKFARVGVRLGFPELVGSQSFLREFCGIGPNNVKDLVLEMLAGRNSNTTLALNS